MSWSQVPTFLRIPKIDLKTGQPNDPKKVGTLYMNPAKDFVQPFELTPSKPNQIIKIPAGGRAGPFPLTAQYDGPIEVFYSKANVYADAAGSPGAIVTDYDIDFLLEHPGKRIQFSNRFVPLIALSGDAGMPYILPETIFIPPVQSLNITLVNNDLLNARHVEIVLGGIKFYPNMAPPEMKEETWKYVQRRESTYAYFMTTDEPVVLNAGQVDSQQFMTIPDNADLEVLKLSAQADTSFRCLIRDGQNDRALTNDRIHSSLLFGGHQPFGGNAAVSGSGAAFPARWATSWLIRRSTKVQLDLTNLDPNNPNTVKCVFGGRKISYVS